MSTRASAGGPQHGSTGKSGWTRGCLACGGLAVLGGGLLFVGLVFWGWSLNRAHESRVESVRQRLSGKRSAATIDQQVACDLAEEQLLKGLFENKRADEVQCAGPYTGTAQRGVLQGLEATYVSTRVPLVACLAHANRWFVVRIARSGECPAGPWAASPATSEPELERHEDSLREAARREDDTDNARRFMAGLDGLKGPLQASARQDRTCPTLDLSRYTAYDSQRLKVPTVDLDVLSSGAPPAADSEWGFLTSPAVASILTAGTSAEDRRAAVRDMERESGPFLVVYRSDQRRWPVVSTEKGFINDKISFTTGQFDGWMILVDTHAARVLCESRLSVRSSESVSFRSRGAFSTKEGRARDAVDSDFKEQFEAAAGAAIKKISGDRLRLGYKWIE
jgi:hypothetical protein